MLEAGEEMKKRGPDIKAGMWKLQIKSIGEKFPVMEWPTMF